MTYTIWMRDRKIGETRFELRPSRRKRAGAFHPTEFGLSVLPGITGMGPALFAFGDRCRRAGIDPNVDHPEIGEMDLDLFAGTPEGQRVIAAAKQIAEVEVRDPAGRTVTWESLAITDVEWMMADARARRPDLAAVATPAPRDPMKFVVSVTLAERQDGVTRMLLPEDETTTLEC